MREYRFRGKRKDNGDWVYGDYCSIPEPNILFVNDNNEVDCSPIEPESVGQYTGFHDVNDTPIYGGDILSFEFKRQTLVGKVLFEKGSFIVVSHKLADGFVWLYEIIDLIEYDVINGVVIGNIYENPELLKAGE